MTTRNIWLTMGLALTLTLPMRAATVTATLDPPQIALGDSTQLTVTVSGAQGEPSVPNVDGLEIISVGESTQVEVINGSITSTSSRTYAVTPQREGSFTIPAISVGGAKSQPVTLRVGQGTPPPAQAQPGPSAGGPVVMPSGPASAADGAQVAKGKYGTIQVTLSKKEFYEGELVPIDIKVYIPEDVDASNLQPPDFSSDGFALDSLGPKPDRAEVSVQGRAYVELTWHSALTALKAGDYTLNFKMPMSVTEAQRMPSMDDDGSVNSFFRNAFAAIGGVRKDVVLTDNTEALKVLPLPRNGRPAGFTGAVGQFEAEASVSPLTVNAGDPLTLKLKISGRGNFDRVHSDGLAGDNTWRTYSPKSHFDADGGEVDQGAKTFEQPVIPNTNSVREVPSLAFSYFDPETGQYVTRTTPPIPVTVTGSVAVAAPAVPPPDSTADAPATPPAASNVNAAADDLRMNRMDSGAFVATLRPVYLSPAFLAAQGVPLLALLAGLAVVRRRRSMSHPDRTRFSAAQQAVRQQIEAMDAAMGAHQADAFFVHARNALQQHFGAAWNMRPEAITVADVEARLGGDRANVRSIFEMADQASYSDLHFEDADLKQWRQVVLDELAKSKR